MSRCIVAGLSLMLMRPGHVLSDASDSDAALCYCFIGFHCSVPDTQTGHFRWAEARRSDFVIHLIISAQRYNLIRKHAFICPIYFQRRLRNNFLVFSLNTC